VTMRLSIRVMCMPVLLFSSEYCAAGDILPH